MPGHVAADVGVERRATYHYLARSTAAGVAGAIAALWIQVEVAGAGVLAPSATGVVAGSFTGLALFAMGSWPPRRWSLRRRHPLGRALTLAVIAVRACAEEIVWRGSLLALEQLHGNGLAWLALTSIAFGFAHERREGRGGEGRLFVAATGATFGSLALLNDDVVTACAAHIVFNVAAFEVGATRINRGDVTVQAGKQSGPASAVAPSSTTSEAAGESAPAAVEWIDVSKRLGRSQALSRFSLTVHRGQITVVLGPNGAGKTTALSLAVGLRRPDEGTVRVLGADPRTTSRRLTVGAAPQDVSFPMTMRVGELVEFTRAHHDDPYPLDDVLSWCGLTKLAARQTGGLSGGERRRLALALALAGRPEILVLDEPTVGLDVDARAAMWQRLRWFRSEGRSVLLTTHDLQEAEQLADVVAVVDRGGVVAIDTPANLRQALGTSSVRFEAHVEVLDDLGRITGDAAVSVMPVGDDVVEVTIVSADSDAVVRRLVGEQIEFRRLRVEEASLEAAIRMLDDGPLRHGDADG